jgi:hypothetical protein
MINIGKKSKQSPGELIAKSIEFFGPSGLGLNIVEQDRCCARFEATDGFVDVEVTENEDESDLNITGREYDYHIKRFLRRLD